MNDLKITLHYEIAGQGDPILFIHGFGATLYTWRFLIAAFSKSHMTIAVDLKGCGKSPKPEDKAYALGDQIELIEDIIERLQLRNLTVAGLSYGGAICLGLAARDAGRSAPRIQRIVLIDAAAYPHELPPYMKLLRSGGLPHISLKFITPDMQIKFILNHIYFDKSKITRDQVAAYANPLKMPGAYHALSEIIKQIVPDEAESLVSAYKSLAIPALIIWGRQDAVLPLALGDRLHRDLKNSQLAIIENCGHVPNEECPEETISVMRNFLASDAAPANSQIPTA
jgi:pimeloyl-ACP methyl ester carboxylesterase